jgi:hypothetical protein
LLDLARICSRPAGGRYGKKIFHPICRFGVLPLDYLINSKFLNSLTQRRQDAKKYDKLFVGSHFIPWNARVY